MTSYRDRLDALVAARGPLCVGIDPHPGLLAQWGLDADVKGLERFARSVVEALVGQVPIFKPQSAFFEVHGARGIAVLEQVLVDIRDGGALSLLDAKRGDIGSTMAGYAQAYLCDGAPLAVDAITLSPFLGFESLRPALDMARDQGRGVYVLARTSNPEGHQVQLSRPTDGADSVAQAIIASAQAENAAGDHHVGLVVGGTHDDLRIDLDGFTGSILVPGIGAQGGTVSGLAKVFTAPGLRLLPTASRDVLSAGPDPEGLRAAARAVSER
ncbi:orotidine-5'-phosphate decarboxylase [Tessaracoccus sp. SD287]|uniref:orotidine-5'-phosphate decarboxylase n=1 Tax=Tessaracoccus sp. SD287 TaxID=2782008 RepID=UPI001A978F38|nr:orotidine-5'-phosphate decarboxylase [Tessaracoccus sp. SD287]MBO1030138.1 orotidine-5'-phosphate decarboxylase [Tessaracoccus sp. SD287]